MADTIGTAALGARFNCTPFAFSIYHKVNDMSSDEPRLPVDCDSWGRSRQGREVIGNPTFRFSRYRETS